MTASRRSFLQKLSLLTGGLAVPAGFSPPLQAAATLERSSPLALGVDPAGIHAFLDALAAKHMELHSFMLLRHGRVVAEGWWSPCESHRPHWLYSLSKSFTSTAAGLLAGGGKLSVEDRVVSFFPGQLPETVSRHLAAMRVKDLLTMSTGHPADPTFEIIREEDWVRQFLATPVPHAPGSHFVYNSSATYILSAIVQKLSGLTLMEFLRPRLFEPLGITDATWETCPRGICTGGWGLSVPTEAIAKFARLYQQNGVWNGRRLIPAAWVGEATAKQVQQPLPENPERPHAENDWLQGYGYQFWRCRHGAFRGDGAFGQLAMVMPDQDAVLAVTAGLGDMQGELDAVWDHLLPAMKPAPLPPDPAAEEKLRARLASLTLPVPAGDVTPPEAFGKPRTWKFENHESGITGVELAFSGDSGTVTFREGDRTHAIVCGLGSWKNGATALPGSPPRLVKAGAAKPGTAHPVAAAGAWPDPARFTLQLRFRETPHHETLTFVFNGEALEVRFLSSITAQNLNPAGSRPPLRGRAV